MSSINILRENLNKIDIDNVVRFIADIILSNIEDIEDYDPNLIYNKNALVYLLNPDTGKHNVYACTTDGVTGVFDSSKWGLFKVSGTNVEDLTGQLSSKADITYVDSQISSVSSTGIPKLVSYEYNIHATSNNQTVFNIPLNNFDTDTDTIIVFIGSNNFVTPDKYTTTSAIIDPETDGFITFTDATLISSILIDTIVNVLILKNVPIGPDGSINGSSISTRSIPQDRISGLGNLLALPTVGVDGTICIVNHIWYQSNGTEWLPMTDFTTILQKIGDFKVLKTTDVTDLISALNSLKTEATGHTQATTAHSATSAATPSRIIIRDLQGRAKIVSPEESDDIARLDNTKEGGDFTGIIKALNNTSYSTAQIRNIILSPLDADPALMGNGVLWFKYKVI